MQYGKTWRTIAKLSLPDKYLRDTADDAPETRSERMFTELEPGFAAHRPGHRPPPRAEDRDRHGAAVGAVTVPPSGSPSRLRHRSAPRAAVGQPRRGRRRARSTTQDAADLVARFRCA